MTKLTPILTVDAIEPLLPFWTDGVGLQVTARVPHPPDREDGPLGFVILARDEAELMLQTRDSVAADLGRAAGAVGLPDLVDEMSRSRTTLFLQVPSVDEILDRISDPQVVVPRRTTFYGMDEIFLLTPEGALLGLAAPVESGG